MLYKKNQAKDLSPDLFRNPTSEYRGTPFWAWNGKMEKDELLRQIEIFKVMGLGGFHMHVRTGLETTYLGEEFKVFLIDVEHDMTETTLSAAGFCLKNNQVAFLTRD